MKQKNLNALNPSNFRLLFIPVQVLYFQFTFSGFKVFLSPFLFFANRKGKKDLLECMSTCMHACMHAVCVVEPIIVWVASANAGLSQPLKSLIRKGAQVSLLPIWNHLILALLLPIKVSYNDKESFLLLHVCGLLGQTFFYSHHACSGTNGLSNWKCPFSYDHWNQAMLSRSASTWMGNSFMDWSNTVINPGGTYMIKPIHVCMYVSMYWGCPLWSTHGKERQTGPGGGAIKGSNFPTPWVLFVPRHTR